MQNPQSSSASSPCPLRTVHVPAAELLHLIECLQSPSVLVVGDVMLDWYITGTIDRISPEAPVPILHVREDAETAKLGGAANVAANVHALGARASVIGVIGDQEPGQFTGQWLRRAMAGQRIRTGGLVPVPGRPTTLKTRIVGLAQNRIPQQILRVDRESSDPLDPTTLDQLEARIRELAPRSAAVCFEDYRKGVLTHSRVAHWIDLARRAGARVLVDPAPISDYARYRGAHCITPNRRETQIACGAARIDTPADVAAHVPAMLERCGIDSAMVTLDRDGMVLIHQPTMAPGTWEAVHLPTRPREVFDVTGAGDAVLAALAIAWASGATGEQAGALANIVGGLEVSHFGCVPIHRSEVLAELLDADRRQHKLLSLDQLLPALHRHRKLGRRIGFTNGCFDLLHPGHLQYLRFCREHCDVLVVGLNSDASVQRQGKRGDRPINPQADRAAMLAGLADVDYICVFDADTPAELIQAIRPDLLIKGEDWSGKGVVGSEFVASYGGRTLLAPLLEGYSSTALMDRVARAARDA